MTFLSLWWQRHIVRCLTLLTILMYDLILLPTLRESTTLYTNAK